MCPDSIAHHYYSPSPLHLEIFDVDQAKYPNSWWSFDGLAKVSHQTFPDISVLFRGLVQEYHQIVTDAATQTAPH